MNKTTIIVLVVAVLTIGGLFLFMSKKKPAPVVSAAPPKSISPQTNLISQIGSFANSAAGQQIIGDVTDYFES